MARIHSSAAALLALAAALLLPALAPAADEDPWHVEGAPEGARIVLATFFGELLPGLREVAVEFEERTGIQVSVQSIPYASYPLWVRTQFLSKEPPEVLLLESGLMAQYGESGLLLSMDELMERPNPLRGEGARAWAEDFRFPLVQQARDARGRLWFVPHTQYSVGFFANRSMLEPLGLEPPADWEQLMGNLRAVRDSGQVAMLVAIKPNDAQSSWAATLLLECLTRPLIPQVNIDHEDGWVFDAADRATTLRERITIEERLVAFERGLIDPARSPQFAETCRLMKDFSATWRPDFLSLDGQEVYEAFSKGGVAHTMNGTWYFGTLLSDLELMREVAPERVFEYETFGFPDLTSASTTLPLAGGINQNAGMRACLILPRQPRGEWRERAAVLLAHYLTIPEVAQRALDSSQSWDISALEEVRPRPEAEPLLPRMQFAFLPVADFMGYDEQSIGQFWPLWQDFLGGKATQEEFLAELSRLHRESLLRVARRAGDELDRAFIHRELGKDLL